MLRAPPRPPSTDGSRVRANSKLIPLDRNARALVSYTIKYETRDGRVVGVRRCRRHQIDDGVRRGFGWWCGRELPEPLGDMEHQRNLSTFIVHVRPERLSNHDAVQRRNEGVREAERLQPDFLSHQLAMQRGRELGNGRRIASRFRKLPQPPRDVHLPRRLRLGRMHACQRPLAERRRHAPRTEPGYGVLSDASRGG